MKYRVSLERDKGGMYVARCRSLTESFSKGKTRRDTLTAVKDAVRQCIVGLKKHNEPTPPSVEEKTVHVGA